MAASEDKLKELAAGAAMSLQIVARASRELTNSPDISTDGKTFMKLVLGREQLSCVTEVLTQVKKGIPIVPLDWNNTVLLCTTALQESFHTSSPRHNYSSMDSMICFLSTVPLSVHTWPLILFTIVDRGFDFRLNPLKKIS